jgi:hypothetical protein
MNETTAYVLVQVGSHRDPIAGLVQTVPGVVFAEDVEGPYDAVALARSNGNGEDMEAIVDGIRALPGVIRALAAPAAHGPDEVRIAAAA